MDRAKVPAKHKDRRASWVPPWLAQNVPDGSTEVIKELRRKRDLMQGPILFNCEAQAPAPLKDFCSIVISKKGVLWRKWKITLRGLTSGSAPLPQPTEECLSHLDFRCDDALVVSKSGLVCKLLLFCIIFFYFLRKDIFYFHTWNAIVAQETATLSKKERSLETVCS